MLQPHQALHKSLQMFWKVDIETFQNLNAKKKKKKKKQQKDKLTNK